MARSRDLGTASAGADMQADRADLDPTMVAVLNRIKRAQGQLAGVLRMIEQGRDPREVIVQLKAVSRATDRAAFAVITGELRRAEALPEEAMAELEAFFASLA